MVQLSHPYMTTKKTIALTTQTFVGKVMSLLFNMLSRLVIAFLPRIRHLLVSWLQSYAVYFLPILFIFMSLSTLLLLPGVFMTPVFHIWGLPIPQNLAYSIRSSLVSCFSGSQISLAPNTLALHAHHQQKEKLENVDPAMYLEAELGKWFMQSLSQLFPDDYGVSSWRGFSSRLMQYFSSEAPRYGKSLYVNKFHSKSASVNPICS